MDIVDPALTFTAFTLYAILHSILASLWAKGKSRALLGALSDRAYRFTYNLFAGISFLPILWVMASNPGSTLYRISWPWLLLSSVFQLAGAAIILAGMLQTDIWHFLGLKQLTQNNPSTESPLVITGLYRYMRHPLYTGGLLLIWFTPQMTTSLLAFNLAATIYLYVGSIFEERRLVAAFGDGYSHYAQQTPRFVPSLRRFRDH